MLEQATLDRIRAEAKSLTPLRSLLTLIASTLFAIGWCASKVVAVLWAACAWTVAAVKVGYTSGRGT